MTCFEKGEEERERKYRFNKQAVRGSAQALDKETCLQWGCPYVLYLIAWRLTGSR